jgi:2-C-methyl-D-erythritol 2,4-cyclodiphosphate synthase/2-C-methyl-D-erythritol 4-phosphate cytidylyltransferase
LRRTSVCSGPRKVCRSWGGSFTIGVDRQGCGALATFFFHPEVAGDEVIIVGRSSAIVVAAGKGERMGGGVKKQFRPLKGRPVLHWALAAIEAAPSIEEIVVVTGASDVAAVAADVKGKFSKVTRVVAGGETRQESVARGLEALGPGTRWVVVHDGARPLVEPALVERVLAAAKESGAATAAVKVKDTIKLVDQYGQVERTLERSRLWAVQTPQAFSRELLERAHAWGKGKQVTDDCGLVEAMGHPVTVVEGSERNLKLTTQEDLAILEALAANGEAQERVPVTGFGLDVHRLAPGRELVLGGVRIPHPLGLSGHSDADVLTHAIMDALLGAAGLGDIGQHFPDTDPAYRGASSLKLLEKVRELVVTAGAQIVHVDAFVSAEAPRLSPYIPDMRRNLAQAMGIGVEWVSIKAGTSEGMGPVGRGEAIEARAVATLMRPSPRFVPSSRGQQAIPAF